MAMAFGLATKITTLTVFRQAFGFVRHLSTATAAGRVEKPKRRKKKNLFEVAQFLPNWGLGYQMAKTHWTGVS